MFNFDKKYIQKSLDGRHQAYMIYLAVLMLSAAQEKEIIQTRR
jgi:hypothetical protein